MIRFVTHILDVLNVLGMQRVMYYTIRFENYDGTVLQESQVQAGTTPVYSGATPTKPQDASYTYTFNGWFPSVDVVTGDQTYTAQYIAVPIPVPEPQYPANELVLVASNSMVDFTPTYTGSIDVEVTYNGETNTETFTSDHSGENIGVSADIGSEIIIRGSVTNILINHSVSKLVTNDMLMRPYLHAATDLQIIDFRNSTYLANSDLAATNIVSQIYTLATDSGYSSLVVHIIQRSTITNGYLFIKRNGGYANTIIAAAEAKGWTVIDLQ